MTLVQREKVGLLFLLWLSATALALYARPLMPIDETRYLTVAWEMHLSGNWLVPHLNGEAYHHKPPLLFWLINIGWLAFGVNETWGRAVAPLSGLAALFLTWILGRRLWPHSHNTAYSAEVGWYGALILFGCAWWLLFSSLTFFDAMLTSFALVGLIGLTYARDGKIILGFGLLGIAIGGGVLTKGPVILVSLLPAALFAPLWLSNSKIRWLSWYLGLLGSLLFGAAIALAWAIPAAIAGGEEFKNAIFWGQSAGRIRDSFAHQRPFWWYIVVLPGLLFPWLLWPACWRGMARLREKAMRQDSGLRFLATVLIPAFLFFSLISGKQPQYLLPLFPAFSLFLARLIADRPDIIHDRDALFPSALVFIAGLALSLGPVILQLRPDLREALDLPSWTVLIYEAAGFALMISAGIAAFARFEGVYRMRMIGTLLILPFALYGVAHFAGRAPLAAAYDLSPTAQFLKEEERKGRPIARIGNYHGEMHFLGRLSKPFAELFSKAEIQEWSETHRHGRLILVSRELPNIKSQPLFDQTFRGRHLSVWDAAVFLDNPDAFLE